MEFVIETMQPDDWPAVLAIYAEGLATGIAAFMTEAPDRADWDDGHLAVGRLVARGEDGSVLGWCALAPVPDT